MSSLDIEDFALDSTQDRQYAYFAITSDEPISDIVNQMPLEPSRYWNVGEKVSRSGREFARRGSRWILESGLKETVYLEEHIRAVVEKIGPISSLVQKLPEHCASSIVCVSFSVQSSGFRLPSSLLSKISNLGVCLEYDFYANVDPHDELAELKSLISRDR